MDKFEGDLKVSIEHGNQRVTFDSPGGEPIESELEYGGLIGTEADFGISVKGVVKGVAKTVTKPARKAVREAAHVERFATTAARAAGRPAHSLVKHANKVTGAVEATARKVPVVGKPLSKTIGLANEPIKFSAALAEGRRVDKAALDSLHRQAEKTVALAPYAQMVAASVPGVGTGVAAGIAAGSALAEGRSINDAAVAAARAAIPGGPAAQAAFDAAHAAASGKSVEDAAVAAAVGAVTRSPAERAQLTAALEIAGGASRGRPVDQVALRAAVSTLDPETRTRMEALVGKPGAQQEVYDALVRGLPPPARRAMVSGIALGHARERQRDVHAAITTPAALDALKAVGVEAIGKSAVLRVAQADVPDKEAFAAGIGLMRHGEVTRPAVLYLRDSMPKERQRVSLDAALAVQIGATTSPRVAAGDRHKVGFYATVGAVPASEEQRRAIVRLLAKKNAESHAGAAQAVRYVRRRRSLYRRMVEWLKARLGG